MHQQFAIPDGATPVSELRRGAADPMQPSGRLPWRMILLASLGGALEFYDFVVFGVFATAIAAAFFPTANPLVSQMLAYAGFAIGYFARPVGGIVLGHFGDRVGRRIVFTGSMLVVSVVTLTMGLLPTYAQCGVAAPLLLLALRLVQGFCLGGEIPGAITYAVETVPKRASLVCGVVFACLNAGVLLATLVNLGTQELLPAAALPGWGWRIGFLVGGLLGLLGFWLRRALEETPAFAQMQRRVARLPLREVITTHPWPVLVSIAVAATTAGFTGLLFVHMRGYLVGVLHYDAGRVAVALNVAIAAASFGLLAVGWLGDHVPRRGLLAAGAVLLLVGCWPWYMAAVERTAPLIVLLVLAAVGGASFGGGVFGAVIADLFPTHVRYSGVALAYNVSFTAFSGTAPLLATVAISATGSAAAPALVMAGCAALTLFGSLWIGQHGGRVEVPGASLPVA
jgi:MHS family proline/betaine transporter-like MFS transporter